MNLKIEFTDLPEFENNLEINISLKKDKNGKVGEDVKVLPDTVPSKVEQITSQDSPKEEKIETKKKERKSKISVVGEGIEAKVSSSTKISKPNESLSTTSDPTTSPSKPKFSGNMMGLDF